MNIAIYIGRRLSFRTGEGNGDENGKGRPSPGVAVAVTGIALSLVIMLVSIAVVVGFKKEIRAKVTGFNAQLTIYPQHAALDRMETLHPDQRLDDLIRSVVPEATISQAVEVPGILKTDSAFQGIVIKGSTAGPGLEFISSQLTEGSMPADTADQVAISATTARELGLKTGDRVFAHFLTDGDLRTRRLTVSGIYDTHFSEYDKRIAVTTLGTARRLGRLNDNECTTVEINGLADDRIAEASSQLSGLIVSEAVSSGRSEMAAVDNVLNRGSNYFSWLDLLDTNVVVILVLMSLVSGFTLISSLFILILDRVSMIGTLKAMGTTNSSIRGIFIYMAERLVARGLLIGNAIGLGLLLLQEHTHLLPLDPEAYYLSYVPVSIDWVAVIALNVSVVALSTAMLIIPSHIVSTLSPAESMRYE